MTLLASAARIFSANCPASSKRLLLNSCEASSCKFETAKSSLWCDAVGLPVLLTVAGSLTRVEPLSGRILVRCRHVEGLRCSRKGFDLCQCPVELRREVGRLSGRVSHPNRHALIDGTSVRWDTSSRPLHVAPIATEEPAATDTKRGLQKRLQDESRRCRRKSPNPGLQLWPRNHPNCLRDQPL